MRQSVRIIEQAANRMPPGRWLSDDYRYIIPRKAETLTDIETLIHHFINVTRGPKIPRGEAYVATEHPRGEQGVYVVSDGLQHGLPAALPVARLCQRPGPAPDGGRATCCRI